jgi:hypothetical protein
LKVVVATTIAAEIYPLLRRLRDNENLPGQTAWTGGLSGVWRRRTVPDLLEFQVGHHFLQQRRQMVLVTLARPAQGGASPCQRLAGGGYLPACLCHENPPLMNDTANRKTVAPVMLGTQR